MSNLFVELKTPVTGAYKQPTGLFINNEFVEGVDKKTFEVINPATEEVICSVHEATEKDVDIAVAAARKAYKGVWKKTAPAERGRLLNKLADLAEKNTDILAAVESLDNGKSITLAKGDVAGVVACLRYYAGWADKVEGKTIDIDPEMFHYTRPEPVCHHHPHVSLLLLCQAMTNHIHNSSAFAVKSSPGTSLFSCLHGRSDPPWPRVTPWS